MSVQPPSNPLWVKIVEALSLQFSWPGLDEDHLRAAETACNEFAKALGAAGPPIQQGGTAYAVAVLGRDGQQVQAAALDLATNGPPALAQAAKQLAAFFGSTADQVEHSKRRIVFMAVVNEVLLAASLVSLFFTGPGAILGATIAEQLFVRQVAEWIAEEIAGLVARIAADAVSAGVEQALAKLAEFGLGTALNIATRQIPMMVLPDALAMASEGKFDLGELEHDAELAGLMGVFGGILGGPVGALLSRLPAGEGRALLQRLLIGFGRNTSHSAIGALTGPLAEQVLDDSPPDQRESLLARYQNEFLTYLVDNLIFSGAMHGIERLDTELHPERITELNERFEALNARRTAAAKSTLDPADTPSEADRSVGDEQPVGDRAAGTPVAEESAPPATAEEPVAESPDQRGAAETVLVPTVGDGDAGRNGAVNRVATTEGVRQQRGANENVGPTSRRGGDLAAESGTADVVRTPDPSHDSGSGRPGFDWAKAVKGSDGPSSDELARQAGFAGRPDHRSHGTGGDRPGIPVGGSNDQPRRLVGLDGTGDGRGPGVPLSGRTGADKLDVAGDGHSGKEAPAMVAGAVDPDRKSGQHPTDPPPDDPGGHHDGDRSGDTGRDHDHHTGGSVPLDVSPASDAQHDRPWPADWTEEQVKEKYVGQKESIEARLDEIRQRDGVRDIPIDTLKEMLRDPDDEVRLAAMYERIRQTTEKTAWIRRLIERLPGVESGGLGGKRLKWTQLAAVDAALHGYGIDMKAGQGKSLVTDTIDALFAVKHDAMHFITNSTDNANRDFARKQELLEPLGIHVRRVDGGEPDASFTQKPDEPTVFVGTATDFITHELKEGRVWGTKLDPDEGDNVLVDQDQGVYLDKSGGNTPADAITEATIIRADDAFWNDGFTKDDFEFAPGRRGAALGLSDSGWAKLRERYGDDIPADAVQRLTRAAHFRYSLRFKDDYTIHDGKIVLIHPVTRDPMLDPATSSLSRWHDGIAQAGEAMFKHIAAHLENGGRIEDIAGQLPDRLVKEISKNPERFSEKMSGMIIRADSSPGSTDHLSATEYFRSYDEILPGSGTSNPAVERMQQLYGNRIKGVVEIPRDEPSQLDEQPNHLFETEDAKTDQIADDMFNQLEDPDNYQPIYAVADHNSLAGDIGDKLEARYTEKYGDEIGRTKFQEKVRVVDADAILDMGTDRSAVMEKTLEWAGQPGHALIGISDRGTDIQPDPTAFAKADGTRITDTEDLRAYLKTGGELKGGLHVIGTAHSAATARNDEQLKYRSARTGLDGRAMPGTAKFYVSRDDDLFAEHPDTFTQLVDANAAWQRARDAYKAERTSENELARNRAAEEFNDRVTELQNNLEMRRGDTSQHSVVVADDAELTHSPTEDSPAQPRAPNLNHTTIAALQQNADEINGRLLQQMAQTGPAVPPIPAGPVSSDEHGAEQQAAAHRSTATEDDRTAENGGETDTGERVDGARRAGMPVHTTVASQSGSNQQTGIQPLGTDPVDRVRQSEQTSQSGSESAGGRARSQESDATLAESTTGTGQQGAARHAAERGTDAARSETGTGATQPEADRNPAGQSESASSADEPQPERTQESGARQPTGAVAPAHGPIGDGAQEPVRRTRNRPPGQQAGSPARPRGRASLTEILNRRERPSRAPDPDAELTLAGCAIDWLADPRNGAAVRITGNLVLADEAGFTVEFVQALLDYLAGFPIMLPGISEAILRLERGDFQQSDVDLLLRAEAAESRPGAQDQATLAAILSPETYAGGRILEGWGREHGLADLVDGIERQRIGRAESVEAIYRNHAVLPPDVREDLLARHRPLAARIAREVADPRVTPEDLTRLAEVALGHAVDDYRPDARVTFLDHATAVIAAYLTDGLGALVPAAGSDPGPGDGVLLSGGRRDMPPPDAGGTAGRTVPSRPPARPDGTRPSRSGGGRRRSPVPHVVAKGGDREEFRVPDTGDPIDVLTELGGRELAALQALPDDAPGVDPAAKAARIALVTEFLNGVREISRLAGAAERPVGEYRTAGRVDRDVPVEFDVLVSALHGQQELLDRYTFSPAPVKGFESVLPQADLLNSMSVRVNPEDNLFHVLDLARVAALLVETAEADPRGRFTFDPMLLKRVLTMAPLTSKAAQTLDREGGVLADRLRPHIADPYRTSVFDPDSGRVFAMVGTSAVSLASMVVHEDAHLRLHDNPDTVAERQWVQQTLEWAERVADSLRQYGSLTDEQIDEAACIRAEQVFLGAVVRAARLRGIADPARLLAAPDAELLDPDATAEIFRRAAADVDVGDAAFGEEPWAVTERQCGVPMVSLIDLRDGVPAEIAMRSDAGTIAEHRLRDAERRENGGHATDAAGAARDEVRERRDYAETVRRQDVGRAFGLVESMVRNTEEEAAAHAAVQTARRLMAELTPKVGTVRAKLWLSVVKQQLKTAEAAVEVARRAAYGYHGFVRLTRADGSVQVLSVSNEDGTVVYREDGSAVVLTSVRDDDGTLLYRNAAAGRRVIERVPLLDEVVAVGALVLTRRDEPLPFAGRYADEASTFHGATPLSLGQLLYLPPAEQHYRLANGELDEPPDGWTPPQELINLSRLASEGKIPKVVKVEPTRDGVVLVTTDNGNRIRAFVRYLDSDPAPGRSVEATRIDEADHLDLPTFLVDVAEHPKAQRAGGSLGSPVNARLKVIWQTCAVGAALTQLADKTDLLVPVTVTLRQARDAVDVTPESSVDPALLTQASLALAGIGAAVNSVDEPAVLAGAVGIVVQAAAALREAAPGPHHQALARMLLDLAEVTEPAVAGASVLRRAYEVPDRSQDRSPAPSDWAKVADLLIHAQLLSERSPDLGPVERKQLARASRRLLREKVTAYGLDLSAPHVGERCGWVERVGLGVVMPIVETHGRVPGLAAGVPTLVDQRRIDDLMPTLTYEEVGAHVVQVSSGDFILSAEGYEPVEIEVRVAGKDTPFSPSGDRVVLLVEDNLEGETVRPELSGRVRRLVATYRRAVDEAGQDDWPRVMRGLAEAAGSERVLTWQQLGGLVDVDPGRTVDGVPRPGLTDQAVVGYVIAYRNDYPKPTAKQLQELRGFLWSVGLMPDCPGYDRKVATFQLAAGEEAAGYVKRHNVRRIPGTGQIRGVGDVPGLGQWPLGGAWSLREVRQAGIDPSRGHIPVFDASNVSAVRGWLGSFEALAPRGVVFDGTGDKIIARLPDGTQLTFGFGLVSWLAPRHTALVTGDGDELVVLMAGGTDSELGAQHMIRMINDAIESHLGVAVPPAGKGKARHVAVLAYLDERIEAAVGRGDEGTLGVLEGDRNALLAALHRAGVDPDELPESVRPTEREWGKAGEVVPWVEAQDAVLRQRIQGHEREATRLAPKAAYTGGLGTFMTITGLGSVGIGQAAASGGGLTVWDLATVIYGTGLGYQMGSREYYSEVAIQDREQQRMGRVIAGEQAQERHDLDVSLDQLRAMLEPLLNGVVSLPAPAGPRTGARVWASRGSDLESDQPPYLFQLRHNVPYATLQVINPLAFVGVAGRALPYAIPLAIGGLLQGFSQPMAAQVQGGEQARKRFRVGRYDEVAELQGTRTRAAVRFGQFEQAFSPLVGGEPSTSGTVDRQVVEAWLSERVDTYRPDRAVTFGPAFWSRFLESGLPNLSATAVAWFWSQQLAEGAQQLLPWLFQLGKSPDPHVVAMLTAGYAISYSLLLAITQGGYWPREGDAIDRNMLQLAHAAQAWGERERAQVLTFLLDEVWKVMTQADPDLPDRRPAVPGEWLSDSMAPEPRVSPMPALPALVFLSLGVPGIGESILQLLPLLTPHLSDADIEVIKVAVLNGTLTSLAGMVGYAMLNRVKADPWVVQEAHRLTEPVVHDVTALCGAADSVLHGAQPVRSRAGGPRSLPYLREDGQLTNEQARVLGTRLPLAGLDAVGLRASAVDLFQRGGTEVDVRDERFAGVECVVGDSAQWAAYLDARAALAETDVEVGADGRLVGRVVVGAGALVDGALLDEVLGHELWRLNQLAEGTDGDLSDLGPLDPVLYAEAMEARELAVAVPWIDRSVHRADPNYGIVIERTRPSQEIDEPAESDPATAATIEAVERALVAVSGFANPVAELREAAVAMRARWRAIPGRPSVGLERWAIRTFWREVGPGDVAPDWATEIVRLVSAGPDLIGVDQRAVDLVFTAVNTREGPDAHVARGAAVNAVFAAADLRVGHSNRACVAAEQIVAEAFDRAPGQGPAEDWPVLEAVVRQRLSVLEGRESPAEDLWSFLAWAQVPSPAERMSLLVADDGSALANLAAERYDIGWVADAAPQLRHAADMLQAAVAGEVDPEAAVDALISAMPLSRVGVGLEQAAAVAVRAATLARSGNERGDLPQGAVASLARVRRAQATQEIEAHRSLARLAVAARMADGSGRADAVDELLTVLDVMLAWCGKTGPYRLGTVLLDSLIAAPPAGDDVQVNGQLGAAVRATQSVWAAEAGGSARDIAQGELLSLDLDRQEVAELGDISRVAADTVGAALALWSARPVELVREQVASVVGLGVVGVDYTDTADPWHEGLVRRAYEAVRSYVSAGTDSNAVQALDVLEEMLLTSPCVVIAEPEWKRQENVVAALRDARQNARGAAIQLLQAQMLVYSARVAREAREDAATALRRAWAVLDGAEPADADQIVAEALRGVGPEPVPRSQAARFVEQRWARLAGWASGAMRASSVPLSGPEAVSTQALQRELGAGFEQLSAETGLGSLEEQLRQVGHDAMAVLAVPRPGGDGVQVFYVEFRHVVDELFYFDWDHGRWLVGRPELSDAQSGDLRAMVLGAAPASTQAPVSMPDQLLETHDADADDQLWLEDEGWYTQSDKDWRTDRDWLNDEHWFEKAVFYELLLPVFKDSTHDGTGDLRGVNERLDYLAGLGIDTIWIPPFYPSPLRDDGYDVGDFRNIRPEFGGIPEFQVLIEEAHKRGIRIVIDMVANHTSIEHPAFLQSRTDPHGPYGDFYDWSDDNTTYTLEIQVEKGTGEEGSDREYFVPADGQRHYLDELDTSKWGFDDTSGVRRVTPMRIFKDAEPSNWTFDPVRDQYYWHRFFHHQPDLNYDNKTMQEWMLDNLRFWLGLGVDGVRLDAVIFLAQEDGTHGENLPETHDFIKRMREVTDTYPAPTRILLCEADEPLNELSIYLSDEECQMGFDFEMGVRIFEALARGEAHPISRLIAKLLGAGLLHRLLKFLRHHDEQMLRNVEDDAAQKILEHYAPEPDQRINYGHRRRLATMLNNDLTRIKLVFALILGLPGPVMIYYGDEIGMGDRPGLSDRDGLRTPMQWTPSGARHGGFTTRARPFKTYRGRPLADPLHRDKAYPSGIKRPKTTPAEVSPSVAAQMIDKKSQLWWMRQILAVRKTHPALALGMYTPIQTENEHVLSYRLAHPEGDVICVLNLGHRPQSIELESIHQPAQTLEILAGEGWFTSTGGQRYLFELDAHDFLWLRVAQPTNPPNLTDVNVATQRPDAHGTDTPSELRQESSELSQLPKVVSAAPPAETLLAEQVAHIDGQTGQVVVEHHAMVIAKLTQLAAEIPALQGVVELGERLNWPPMVTGTAAPAGTVPLPPAELQVLHLVGLYAYGLPEAAQSAARLAQLRAAQSVQADEGGGDLVTGYDDIIFSGGRSDVDRLIGPGIGSVRGIVEAVHGEDPNRRVSWVDMCGGRGLAMRQFAATDNLAEITRLTNVDLFDADLTGLSAAELAGLEEIAPGMTAAAAKPVSVEVDAQTVRLSEPVDLITNIGNIGDLDDPLGAICSWYNHLHDDGLLIVAAEAGWADTIAYDRSGDGPAPLDDLVAALSAHGIEVAVDDHPVRTLAIRRTPGTWLQLNAPNFGVVRSDRGEKAVNYRRTGTIVDLLISPPMHTQSWPLDAAEWWTGDLLEPEMLDVVLLPPPGMRERLVGLSEILADRMNEAGLGAQFVLEQQVRDTDHPALTHFSVNQFPVQRWMIPLVAATMPDLAQRLFTLDVVGEEYVYNPFSAPELNFHSERWLAFQRIALDWCNPFRRGEVPEFGPFGEPLREILADPDTDEAVRERLQRYGYLDADGKLHVTVGAPADPTWEVPFGGIDAPGTFVYRLDTAALYGMGNPPKCGTCLTDHGRWTLPPAPAADIGHDARAVAAGALTTQAGRVLPAPARPGSAPPERASLEALLDTFTPVDRAIMLQRFGRERQPAEIAEAVGVTADAVQEMIDAALGRLSDERVRAEVDALSAVRPVVDESRLSAPVVQLVDILSAVRVGQPMTGPSITDRVGFDPIALVESGLLRRDPDGQFWLGPATLSLGDSYLTTPYPPSAMGQHSLGTPTEGEIIAQTVAILAVLGRAPRASAAQLGLVESPVAQQIIRTLTACGVARLAEPGVYGPGPEALRLALAYALTDRPASVVGAPNPAADTPEPTASPAKTVPADPRTTVVQQLALMVLLANWENSEDTEMYPLEIIRMTGVKSGSLYPTLDSLVAAGRIVRREEEGDLQRLGRPLRTFYRLTDPDAADWVRVRLAAVEPESVLADAFMLIRDRCRLGSESGVPAAPFRAPRDGPRVTLPQHLALMVLLANWESDPTAEMFGAELARRVGVLPGTLYVLLPQLVSAGHIVRRKEVGDPHRLGRPLQVYYRLTDSGAAWAPGQLAKLPPGSVLADVFALTRHRFWSGSDPRNRMATAWPSPTAGGLVVAPEVTANMLRTVAGHGADCAAKWIAFGEAYLGVRLDPASPLTRLYAQGRPLPSMGFEPPSQRGGALVQERFNGRFQHAPSVAKGYAAATKFLDKHKNGIVFIHVTCADGRSAHIHAAIRNSNGARFLESDPESPAIDEDPLYREGVDRVDLMAIVPGVGYIEVPGMIGLTDFAVLPLATGVDKPDRLGVVPALDDTTDGGIGVVIEREAYRQAVARMGDRERRIAELRYVYEWTAAEIAAVTPNLVTGAPSVQRAAIDLELRRIAAYLRNPNTVPAPGGAGTHAAKLRRRQRPVAPVEFSGTEFVDRVASEFQVPPETVRDFFRAAGIVARDSRAAGLSRVATAIAVEAELWRNASLRPLLRAMIGIAPRQWILLAHALGDGLDPTEIAKLIKGRQQSVAADLRQGQEYLAQRAFAGSEVQLRPPPLGVIGGDQKLRLVVDLATALHVRFAQVAEMLDAATSGRLATWTEIYGMADLPRVRRMTALLNRLSVDARRVLRLHLFGDLTAPQIEQQAMMSIERVRALLRDTYADLLKFTASLST